MYTGKRDKPFILLENAKVENAKCTSSEGWERKTPTLFLAFHDQNLHARACTAFTACTAALSAFLFLL